MRYLWSVLVFLLCHSLLLSAAENSLGLKETEPSLVLLSEIKRLEHLIHITEENLANQQSLKKQFLDFQKIQLRYLENTQNKEVTLQMVQSAHALLEAIKQYHLTQVFDPEFISQLTFFSQFASKRSVPKP